MGETMSESETREPDEIATAGEYVLGTLSAPERAAFDARLENDAAAQRAVAFWRERLAPLDDVAAPIAPPDRLWSEIESVLPPPVVPAAANDNLLKLRRSRNRWRGAAVAAALAAVAGTLIALNDEARSLTGLDAGPQVAGPVGAPVEGLNGGEYVAVVNRDGSLPALVVSVDGGTGEVSVRALDMPKPGEGRSYEVWYVSPGEDPVSVGLMDEPGATIAAVEAEAGGTFAITEEARGGSPTGKAQGPMMFSGKLVKLPD